MSITPGKPPAPKGADSSNPIPKRGGSVQGAAVIYFVVATVLAIVAAVIVAVLVIVVRTKGQLKECFFVAFPDGAFPTEQSKINDVVSAMQCAYASYGQLMAALDDGAQWCQAGFFDLSLSTGLISGVGWPNHVVGTTANCGATGINYIAVPVVNAPNGDKAADLASFSSKVTGFIAFGLKPNSHNVNPPGSILPFAPGGRWSQYDDPPSSTLDSPAS